MLQNDVVGEGEFVNVGCDGDFSSGARSDGLDVQDGLVLVKRVHDQEDYKDVVLLGAMEPRGEFLSLVAKSAVAYDKHQLHRILRGGAHG